MEQEFITAGKIVGTHGVRGELKLLPLGIEAAYLTAFPTYYIDGSPVTPTASRVHKGCLLMKLPHVEDMDAALALKGKTVAVRRRDGCKGRCPRMQSLFPFRYGRFPGGDQMACGLSGA